MVAHSRAPGVQLAPSALGATQVFWPVEPTHRLGAAQSLDEVHGPEVAALAQIPATLDEPPTHFKPDTQPGPLDPLQALPAGTSATHCPGVDLDSETGALQVVPCRHSWPSQVHAAPCSRKATQVPEQAKVWLPSK